MYNGSNIFAKQHPHNLHRENTHLLLVFPYLLSLKLSPGNRLVNTGQRLWLSLCSESWNLSMNLCASVCVQQHARPLFHTHFLPEVSAHLQRREELVLNYKQVCFLPSFVLLIIPWAHTVHNKGWYNKPLSCEKAGK